MLPRPRAAPTAWLREIRRRSQTAPWPGSGFADPARAAQLLADPALAGLVDPLDDVFSDGLPDALGVGRRPRPRAAVSLVRLMESLRASAPRRRDVEAGRRREVAGLVAALRHPGRRATGCWPSSGPPPPSATTWWPTPSTGAASPAPGRCTPQERVAELVAAVREPGVATRHTTPCGSATAGSCWASPPSTSPSDDPVASLPEAAAALADLAEAALEAALVIARAELGEPAELCDFAVIGMGKTGGRELNYVSDVDVIFVAEPRDGCRRGRPRIAAATALATHLMRACSTSHRPGHAVAGRRGAAPGGQERPAGADHRQPPRLLRAVGQDLGVPGAAQGPDRWPGTATSARPTSPPSARWCGRRRRARTSSRTSRPCAAGSSSTCPRPRRTASSSSGPGGLRDVEFSVQLLQLVHGRSDDSLRSGTTLEALDALARGGYVGREDAATLDASYRLLRTLEHRIQLFRLRRTHLMPTADTDLRRLGRALGHRSDAAKAVVAQWQQQAREVRRIHERLFYRPLLAAVARLSSTEARLGPEAARDRLAALGFRDPAGAMRHLEALTAGVSRRAAIQRTLLPVMLGWFADEADPDGGLLAFRKVSEELGSTHWYLRLLRDEGSAAERLAHTLARSRYAADLLVGAPESVAILGDAGGLAPRSREDLVKRMSAAAGRQDDPDTRGAGGPQHPAAGAVPGRRGRPHRPARPRGRRRGPDRPHCGPRRDRARGGRAAPSRTEPAARWSPAVLVVGHGPARRRRDRLRQRRRRDVRARPEPGTPRSRRRGARPGAGARGRSRSCAGCSASAGPDPQLGLDADLRPEGKSGPLVRSLASYRAYYERWSLTWESQALLRATPLAGDADARQAVRRADRPAALAPGRPHRRAGPGDPHAQGPDGGRAAAPRRRPQEPLQARPRRPVRRRVDRAAASRCATPTTIPELRTTGTLAALDAAEEAG